MAVVGINYTGGAHDYDDAGNFIEITPVSYESVYLHTNKGKTLFDSGDFVKDWYNARKKFFQEICDEEPFLSHSSSCDHFIMDGAKYDSAYLHIEDGNGILKYVDRSDPDWHMSQRDIFEEGDEIFVKEGTTPTWDEFKELVK